MNINRKIHTTRSESLDTVLVTLCENCENSERLSNDETEKLMNESQSSIYVHKKVVSYSCVEFGKMFEDNSTNFSRFYRKNVWLALKNLDKILRIFLIGWINRWKGCLRAGRSQKLFLMVAVLHRIFLQRGKRVFDPPRVIKDADEIMSRTIKKIFQIKFRLFEAAFIRWKYFRMAMYTKEKAVVFYRACQVAGHLFKDAFNIWRHKTLALDSIRRTAATGKFQRVLSKAFRSRFKLFVFSTYLKIGPKKAANKIFSLFASKYIEQRRIGFERFKFFLTLQRCKNRQIRRDKKIVKLFLCWRKVIKINLERGWTELNRAKRNKLKLVKLLIHKWRLKRNYCWDILKLLRKEKEFKFKAIKIQTAVQKVTRRQQRWGFIKFLPNKFPVGSISAFPHLYKSFLNFAFNKIKVIAKDNQIVHIKDTTRYIRSTHRKTQLRSSRLAGKNMTNNLHKLLKKHWKVLFTAQETIKSQQLSLKLCAKYFLTKPRHSISIWKEFTGQQSAKDFRKSINSEKLKFFMNKIPLRNMKTVFSQLFERRAQVVTATRVFTRQLGKKPKLIITRWHRTIESIHQGLLFDACRSQKLKESLNKIIKFSIKEHFWRICAKPVRVFMAIGNVFKLYRDSMRSGFAGWKNAIATYKRERVLKALKSIQLKKVFGKMMGNRFKDTLKVLIPGNKVKQALRALFLKYSQRTLVYFMKWRKICKRDKKKSRVTALYAKVLRHCLGNVVRKEIFEVFKRMVKKKFRVEKVFEMYLFRIKDMSRQAFVIWRFYVLGCKTKIVLDRKKSLSLKINLNRIVQKVLKNIFSRLIGNGKLVKGYFLSINSKFTSRLQKAFQSWTNFSQVCEKKNILTAFRREKLKSVLKSLTTRTTLYIVHRITGAGNTIRSIFSSILKIYEKKIKNLFQSWKNYAINCKSLKIYTLKTASPILKTLLKSLTAPRIQKYFLRIISANDPIVKGALNMITSKIIRKLKQVLNVWKNFVFISSSKKLFDNIRFFKLKDKFERLSSRRVKNHFFRLISAGGILAGKLIARFYSNLSVHFTKWNFFSNMVGKNAMLCMKKSLDLKQLLVKICKRVCLQTFKKMVSMKILKKSFKNLMKASRRKLNDLWCCWKMNLKSIQFYEQSKELQHKVNALKLSDALKGIRRKRLRCARMILDNVPYKVKVELKVLIFALRKGLRSILYCWKDSLYRVKASANRGKMLCVHLNKLSLKPKRFVFKNIIQKFRAYVQFIKTCKKLSNSQQIALTRWKTTTDLLSILKKIKALVIKNAIFCVLQRLRSKNFSIFTQNQPNLLSTLTKLSNVLNKHLRTSLRKWQKSSAIKQYFEIFLHFKANRLKHLSLTLLKHKFSQFTHKLLYPLNPMRKFLILWLQNYRSKLKSSLTQWEKFSEKCKNGELLDAFRSVNLRKHLSNTYKRFLRDSIDRILGLGNRVRGSLRRVMLQVQKTLFLRFAAWKSWVLHQRSYELWFKLKSSSLRSTCKRVLERSLKNSVDRIIGNGKSVFGKLLRIFSHFKFKYLNCFQSWKENINRLKQRDIKRGSNTILLFNKIIQRMAKIMFESFAGNTRIRRVFEKMEKNLKVLQSRVMQVMWTRAEKIRMVKKINAAFMLVRHFDTQFRDIKKIRFSYWKNLEAIRKKRILRKAVGKMIQHMSINYESGFWKWKFVMTSCGRQFNPRHSIFFRRLSTVVSNYRKRLEQFSLFKLVLNFKSQQISPRVNLPKAIAQIIKNNEVEQRTSSAVSYERIVEIGEDEDQVCKIGALGVIFMLLSCVKLRKFAWVLSALYSNFRHIDCFDNEREFFKEQLAELRYEKHSLLEDNNILRIHNDNLIVSLEKNTEDLEEISLSMDYFKISAMFKALVRVLENNLLTSFYKLGIQFEY